MSVSQFDRDAMARWYAKRHIDVDPGVVSIHYLPTGASSREIRLVEVNELMAERRDDVLEPVDFGVDFGTEDEHQLFILDVTPGQWERIRASKVALPNGWSLENSVAIHR